MQASLSYMTVISNNLTGKKMKVNPLRQEENKVTWLMVLVLAILVIGFSVTTGLSYFLTKDYIIDTEISQTLPLISDTIYTGIMEELITPINTSSLMANDTYLIDWVQSGENDLQALTNYLGLIKQEYGYASTFFVSDLSHNYYTSQGILKQISPDDDHDSWYFQFVDLNVNTDLDVDTDQAADNTLTVFINHRLETVEHQFLGVIGVGLEISDISKKLAEYQERFNHQAYFVDSSGLIQVHPNRNYVETKTLADISELAESSEVVFDKESKGNIIEYENSAGENVLSVRYFPEFDWFLIIEKNHGETLLAAKRVIWQNLSIGFGVSLLVGFLILQLIRIFHQRLAYLAATDPLTELSNRRSFSSAADREFKLAQRYHNPLSLLLIDIVNFKSINDEYGHVFGDQLLKTIAQTIRDTLRETDLIGRWGGDEFVALLINTGLDEAQNTAERIKKAVSDINQIARTSIKKQHIYIGITTNSPPGDSFSDLIQLADENLIRSKLVSKKK